MNPKNYNQSKLLSIAIPTYNRCETLKRTLENIINQIIINGYQNLIEIAVSDNASTDDTESVVCKFQAEYPNLIVYSKNDENIIWQNIKKASDIASGKYVWFCGDDDEYFFDTVKKIINIIQTNDIDTIYLNQVNTRGYITQTAKDCIVNLKDFFKIVRQDPEFISTVIIKKNLINPKIKIFTWYHFACLLNLPHDAKCYITKEPFVYNKPSERSWINHKNLVNYTIDALETTAYSTADTETKNDMINIYNIMLVKRIIHARLKGDKKIMNYEEIVEKLNKIYYDTGFEFKDAIKYAKSKLMCKLHYNMNRYRKFKIPLGRDIIEIESI